MLTAKCKQVYYELRKRSIVITATRSPIGFYCMTWLISYSFQVYRKSFLEREFRVGLENPDLSKTMGSNALLWHMTLGFFPRRPLMSSIMSHFVLSKVNSPQYFTPHYSVLSSSVNSREDLSAASHHDHLNEHQQAVRCWQGLPGCHPGCPMKAISRHRGHCPEDWGSNTGRASSSGSHSFTQLKVEREPPGSCTILLEGFIFSAKWNNAIYAIFGRR